MISLPKLTDLDVTRKKVIVRMDLDVGEDYTRIETAKNTLSYLIDNKAKTLIIGHKGRPDGNVIKESSLEPLGKVIGDIISREVKFVDEIIGEKVNEEIKRLSDSGILLLENLRFDSRESFDPAQAFGSEAQARRDAGAEEFAKQLATFGDFYVNEAFAVSHRAHASITGLPKFLPHAAGMRFG